jgi:TolA-binding protein
MVGCSNPEGKSQKLFETAQFEEQQNNFKHARQLYQEIIRKYPETSFAYKSASRLETLGE